MSPCGNFLTDPCDSDIGDEEREWCVQYLAALTGLEDVTPPSVEQLVALARVDTVEEILVPGDPAEMRPAIVDTTIRRYLLFTPEFGPKYGFSFPMAALDNLDEDPIYGLDFYYLHRSGGSPTGQLLSWVDAGSSLRTSGVSVKSRSNPTKVEFSSAYWYLGYDAPGNRKVTHPCSQQFTPENCDDITETCTAVSYYATNGFTWRPGCVAGQCADPARYCGDEGLLTTAAGPNTRGCPNVHYYSNWNGGVDYTGYNDDRWRIDNATLEGYATGIPRVATLTSHDYGLVIGRTVYALCVPYFKAYVQNGTADTAAAPLWYQMYNGWLTDTAWSFSSCSMTNWRGAANVLRSGGEWLCNSGCCEPGGFCLDGCAASYCPSQNETTVMKLWMNTWNGVYKFPHKAKMLWWSGSEPWVDSGKIYGRHRIWNYGFSDPCSDGIDARVTRTFGYVDFTDNDYTTTLAVTYRLGTPH